MGSFTSVSNYDTLLNQLNQPLAFLLKTPIIGGMRLQLEKIASKFNSWNKLVLAAVGLLLLGWLLNTPGGLLGKADAIGYAVCHRIDLRSFHLGERQLPLCARCTGMYLGALVGLGFQQITANGKTGTPHWSVIGGAACLAGAFAIDGLNSYLTLLPGFPTAYQPQNWLRLLTGSGMGVAVSIALYPAFNLTIWKQTVPEPAIGSLRSFAGILAIVLLVNGAALLENPLLLYPLALISAFGVLFLLTMVYTMVWVMILQRENTYENTRQLFLPLIAGFGMALLQITILDIGRFLLTGSWDGFYIG